MNKELKNAITSIIYSLTASFILFSFENFLSSEYVQYIDFIKIASYILFGFITGYATYKVTKLVVANSVNENNKAELKQLMIDESHHLHNLAHETRDLAVRLMEPKRNIIPFDGELKPLSGLVHYDHLDEINQILSTVISIFKPLVSKDVKIWTCIRERKNDDCYHTFIRVGEYTKSRKQFSEPLHKESKIVKHLKHSYEVLQHCVIVTGSEEPEWDNVKNNKYKEDLSVLMGAVLSKSWDGEKKFEKPKLNWILCVNANKENVFDESFIPLMKFCNDVFSLLVNSFIRKAEADIIENNIHIN